MKEKNRNLTMNIKARRLTKRYFKGRNAERFDKFSGESKIKNNICDDLTG